MTMRRSKLPAFILEGWRTLLIGAVGGVLVTVLVMSSGSGSVGPAVLPTSAPVAQIAPSVPHDPGSPVGTNNTGQSLPPPHVTFTTPLAAMEAIERLSKVDVTLLPEQWDRELADLRAYAKGNLILEIELTGIAADRQMGLDISSEDESFQKTREAMRPLVNQTRELQEWARSIKIATELQLATLESSAGENDAALKLTESVLSECEAAFDPLRERLSQKADNELTSFYCRAISEWMSLTVRTEGSTRYFAPGALGIFSEFPPHDLHRVVPMPESMGRTRRSCISLLGSLLADENVPQEEKASIEKAHQFVVDWVAQDEKRAQESFLSSTRRPPNPHELPGPPQVRRGVKPK